MKYILTVIALLLHTLGIAQTVNPVANDISMSIFNGLNNTLRYVDTDKTGRLQFVMYGQDPTTGTTQLRPQRRTFGPSIVCGSTFDSTCDVVAAAVSIYSAQIADSTATGRAVLTASDAPAARLAIGAGTSNFDGGYASLTGVPATFTPAMHTQPSTTISDSTAIGRSILTAADAGAIRALTSTPSISEVAAGYYPLASNPSAFLTGITGAQVTTALGLTPVNLAGARGAVSLTTTGSGAATYNSGTGVINVPTPAGASPFNFSQPIARTLAVSTSYQALDTTKAAVIVPSYACQNATQVLAASACTIQVRMGTGALTCSTGTVYYTQSLTVALGVLITQNSTNPVPISLPIGASFILCPVAGTFTITTVEQSAG